MAATAVAIGVTSAIDGSGLTAFSALPLFPLAGLLLFLSRLSPRRAGLRWGAGRYYGRAAVYPLIVIGLCAAIALGAGAASFARVDWTKALGNIVLVTMATIVIALIIEEGFFRGALWAALVDARQRRAGTLLWSSIAFALWHISQ